MDKKSKIKTGLTFGIATCILSVVLDLLKEDPLTTKDVITSNISGLFSGAFSGFLFGWLMGLFSKSKFFVDGTEIVTEAGEIVLFETAANHFKRMEGVGGKLYLTNNRLVFKSHQFNIQDHLLSLNLSEIKKVDRFKSLGILNNGLAVTTIGNKIEKFVVQQPGEWVTHLMENGVA